MKKILFDLDGTLTDSGEGIIHCAQQTLEYFGLPIPSKHALRVIVGPPLRDSFLRFGIPENKLDEAVEIYRKHYVHHGKYENFPYPGIETLLQRLKEDGHHLYVATSKPEAMSIDILEYFGLAKYFDIICGAASDHSRNTKAKVIDHLLHQLQPINSTLIMVGDTIYDIEGAHELNLPAIGVTWGYGVVEDMMNAGAEGIASSMDELYLLLTQY